MNRRTSVAAGAFVLLCVETASLRAQAPIPNVSLEVTVRQRENGKLGRGLHILELSCWEGRCSFTSLSLNQCGPSGEGKQAFYPKVERFSTLQPSFSVQSQGTTLVATDKGVDSNGDFVRTFRFEYEAPKGGGTVTRVIGFSGGMVKNSNTLNKVLAVEYIPLPKYDQVVSLDCGALLRGVQR